MAKTTKNKQIIFDFLLPIKILSMVEILLNGVYYSIHPFPSKNGLKRANKRPKTAKNIKKLTNNSKHKFPGICIVSDSIMNWPLRS